MLEWNSRLVLEAEKFFFFSFRIPPSERSSNNLEENAVSQKDSRGVGEKITVKAGVLNRKIIGDHETHNAFS